MNRAFFKNREGQTPVEEEMRFDFIPKHVQDMSELYELESENIALATSWCESTNKDHLNYSTWLELHKQMYNEVWKFAGVIKKIEHQNPDFLKPYDVRPALLQLEKDLRYWIEHKSYVPKEMMAHFHERLLTIHPFKDGNGRWSRILTNFVCTREGYPEPDWGVNIEDDKVRRDLYINAIRAARHDFNFDGLVNIMWYRSNK